MECSYSSQHFLIVDFSNDKATFYTDTVASSHLRGRKSIVPSVEECHVKDRHEAQSESIVVRCANILGKEHIIFEDSSVIQLFACSRWWKQVNLFKFFLHFVPRLI
jgi:hypothetical protein